MRTGMRKTTALKSGNRNNEQEKRGCKKLRNARKGEKADITGSIALVTFLLGEPEANALARFANSKAFSYPLEKAPYKPIKKLFRVNWL